MAGHQLCVRRPLYRVLHCTRISIIINNKTRGWKQVPNTSSLHILPFLSISISWNGHYQVSIIKNKKSRRPNVAAILMHCFIRKDRRGLAASISATCEGGGLHYWKQESLFRMDCTRWMMIGNLCKCAKTVGHFYVKLSGPKSKHICVHQVLFLVFAK